MNFWPKSFLYIQTNGALFLSRETGRRSLLPGRNANDETTFLQPHPSYPIEELIPNCAYHVQTERSFSNPFPSHLRGRAFPHALSVRTVACELSQRTPNRTIAALAQRALLRSFPQHLPQIPPQQARTGRRGQTMSRFCKKWQKFAVVNGLSTPKRPQRCFVFTKPQVTIYRRQEQCTPYRAQPQICAKKLTIRTKYQVRANCSRRHQQ